MIALSCSEARDLACNLLDGELSPELEQAVDEHLTGCPTCPALHSALLTVRGELQRLRPKAEAKEGRWR